MGGLDCWKAIVMIVLLQNYDTDYDDRWQNIAILLLLDIHLFQLSQEDAHQPVIRYRYNKLAFFKVIYCDMLWRQFL